MFSYQLHMKLLFRFRGLIQTIQMADWSQWIIFVHNFGGFGGINDGNGLVTILFNHGMHWRHWNFLWLSTFSACRGVAAGEVWWFNPCPLCVFASLCDYFFWLINKHWFLALRHKACPGTFIARGHKEFLLRNYLRISAVPKIYSSRICICGYVRQSLTIGYSAAPILASNAVTKANP